MKILLDHNLDWRLGRYLEGHEVISTINMGWAALENGKLLSAAEVEGFQVMLTADSNVNYQQNFSFRSIALIVLRALNNRRQTHLPMMPEVKEVLLAIQPGQVVEVLHENMKRKS